VEVLRLLRKNTGHKMITHRSCLEALAEPCAAEAFDFLACLWLLPVNATQKAEGIGLDHHLQTWRDYAEDLG
jgi:hypothetical protein